ncbi:MAG: hypothetical protein OXF89_01815 [Rhodospirillaceae bacterium]|nr:hypothetical protein [Rhodospirillaceae bacterium]
MKSVDPDFDRNVFVNCPFDSEYEHILKAILFCLVRFGLNPRIARERNDAGEPRIEKILELIQSSRFSIHDLSRCQAREAGEHYRLNMPFELGIDFGCRRYGGEPFTKKVILILEEQPYRYQAAISDLAGNDIVPHRGEYEIAVRKIRNWLIERGGFERIGAAQVLAEYEDFQQWYYELQLEAGFSEEDIQDYSTAELLDAMLGWTLLR